jgi:DNA-binding NarL/FixJ family response regulator
MIGDAGELYQVIATFARLRDADDYFGKNPVDLLILDDMTLHTIEVIRAIGRYHELYPGLSLIVLSNRRDGEYVQQVMRYGSAGYVLKNGDLQGPLLTAIKLAGEKYPFLSPEAAKIIGNRREGKLNLREMEVLRLMEQELSVKEIGEHLNLSVKTIYRIRDKLKQALGVRNNESLVDAARKHGLLDDRE